MYKILFLYKKYENLSIVESLYREQTGGVLLELLYNLTHIIRQEVTDYEISYKLDSVDNVGSTDDGGTRFNFI